MGFGDTLGDALGAVGDAAGDLKDGAVDLAGDVGGFLSDLPELAGGVVGAAGDTAAAAAEDVVTALRGVLADLEGIDLWPPWDAAVTVANAAARAWGIAGTPPEPDPARLLDAAAVWRAIATDTRQATADVATAREAIDTGTWSGQAGDAFRSSAGVLGSRLGSLPEAAGGVESALRACAGPLAEARERHRAAHDLVAQHLTISWSDLTPFGLRDYLAGIVGALIEAVGELIGAYEDAAEAVARCRRDVRLALDELDLPAHLPEGPSPIDTVNAWDDGRGSLSDLDLAAYDEARERLTPAEQRALDALLAGADDPRAKALIMAAVAAGLSGAALARYAQRVATMSGEQLEALDASGFRGDAAEQPDQTTCGSSSLVMSKMENDPAYALWMLTGYDPETGEVDPRSPAERFEDESLRMHDRTNAPTDRDGDLQVPWPEGLGTQPWALANEMSAEGGAGVPGTDYGVSTVDPGDRGASFDAAAEASASGHTVPVYVGDGTRPGHVVLVTGADGDRLTIYEPYHGETITVDRDDWVSGDLDVAGWSEPWFVVTPR